MGRSAPAGRGARAPRGVTPHTTPRQSSPLDTWSSAFQRSAVGTVRRLCAGLSRWYRADDVEPKRRAFEAMRRQLGLVLVVIPLGGGSLVSLLGSAFGWW